MLKRSAHGFTIIEVMIVLVIAAVILLIVFLAIPALQRNSRNTQRKNDVGLLTTTFLEYLNMPNPIPSGNASSNAALSLQIKNDANVTTFTLVQITNGYNVVVTQPGTTDNLAQFRTRSKCNDAGTNVDGTISNGRVALLYWLETNGAMQIQCAQVR